MELHFLSVFILSTIVPLMLFLYTKLKTASPSTSSLPKSYPIIGSFLAVYRNRHRAVEWTSAIVTSTPNLTFTLHRGFGQRHVITANAANVQHILKSNFNNYDKGDAFKSTLKDLLGDGIFNADGDSWRFQRQVSSNEFSTKSLKKFVEQVVDAEISDRLIPFLKSAAGDSTVIDFQDIFLRFAFDNVCKIAFGYDPEYLSPSLPPTKFAIAFEKAVELSIIRVKSLIPNLWRIKKVLNFKSEKQLKVAVDEVREFAKGIVRIKKRIKSSAEADDDLLSRFLSSGHSDEDFVIDIVISFIVAGKDTTSAALTWFFWLLSEHPEVENQILMEARQKSDTAASAYDEVKQMIYTHASLCETMRLYPPVPIDPKAAVEDDVLPDGTIIKKGMRVIYHPYAMGRVERVWGEDWAEFRPSRWLEKAAGDEKWSFVDRDSFTYPVFQAGPRICLGKTMAFVQMKRVVAAVVRQFRVVPVGGEVPVFVSDLTTRMKGGFPVRIEERT